MEGRNGEYQYSRSVGHSFPEKSAMYGKRPRSGKPAHPSEVGKCGYFAEKNTLSLPADAPWVSFCIYLIINKISFLKKHADSMKILWAYNPNSMPMKFLFLAYELRNSCPSFFCEKKKDNNPYAGKPRFCGLDAPLFSRVRYSAWENRE